MTINPDFSYRSEPQDDGGHVYIPLYRIYSDAAWTVALDAGGAGVQCASAHQAEAVAARRLTHELSAIIGRVSPPAPANDQAPGRVQAADEKLETAEELETGDDPQTRAAYPARCVAWNARQEEIGLARLAFNKHRDRNAKRKVRNAPGSTPRTSYNKSYYEGGYRMVIDGVPIRAAAHVKTWKPSNRAALCQGFDPWGLMLQPHGKNGYPIDATPRPYWKNYLCVRTADGYGADGNFHGRSDYLFTNRADAEYEFERELRLASRPVDLWIWARRARRAGRTQGMEV